MNPRRIGPYEIVMLLAAGERAQVFLARRPGTTEYFALRLTDKRGVPFQKTLLRLRHENIVDVIDVGEAPEGAYLVQEYVPGASLSGLRHGEPPLSTAVALRVVVDALFGMHAVHEHARLVHRDFTARNIMVGTDGVGRLVVGVDPDLSRGLASEETLAADLRMAGIAVWEILAGRELDTPEPPRLRDIKRDVSAKLDKVVARALSLDKNDRVLDARRFGEELAAAAAGSHLLADRPEVMALVELRVAPLLRERREVLDAVRRDLKNRPPSMPDVRTLIGTPGPPTLKRAPLPSLPDAPASSDGPSELRLAVVRDHGDRADSGIVGVVAPPPAAPPAPDTEPEVYRSPVVVEPVGWRRYFTVEAWRKPSAMQISVACAVGGLGLGFVVVLAAVGRKPEAETPVAPPSASASAVAITSAEPPPPPAPDPEPALEPTLEVTANARIASVKIGEREVDAVVPAPQISVELGPDESDVALRVSATAVDGRIATATAPAGARSLALTFAERPAKPRVGTGSGTKRTKRR